MFILCEFFFCYFYLWLCLLPSIVLSGPQIKINYDDNYCLLVNVSVHTAASLGTWTKWKFNSAWTFVFDRVIYSLFLWILHMEACFLLFYFFWPGVPLGFERRSFRIRLHLRFIVNYLHHFRCSPWIFLNSSKPVMIREACNFSKGSNSSNSAGYSIMLYPLFRLTYLCCQQSIVSSS